ncbi:MAG: stage II sporulation protein M [Candidatus Pacearchaeota archaeon]
MKELKENLSFLRSKKRIFYFSIFLFFASTFLGYFFPLFEGTILKTIKELLKMFEGKNFFESFLLLFFNNARSSLFAIVLGLFFSVIPLLILFFNGYLIGFVVNLVAKEKSLFEIWRLLPHGIFELPAFFISCVLGMNLGLVVLREFSFKKTIESLEQALRIFVSILIPLLLIAAFIEALLIFSAK